MCVLRVHVHECSAMVSPHTFRSTLTSSASAQLDWRPLLPRIGVPCLNVVGGRSGVFPVEGTATVGQLIPHCHTVRQLLRPQTMCRVTER